jgi:hypothetical protein
MMHPSQPARPTSPSPQNAPIAPMTKPGTVIGIQVMLWLFIALGYEVGYHQHDELDQMMRVGDERVQNGKRPACDRQRDREHDETFDVLTCHVRPAADPEREATVRCGVSDGGQQQCDQVGRLRAERPLHQHEQHCVRRRRHHPDRGESHDLPEQRARCGRAL